jgi:hypothetical protein
MLSLLVPFVASFWSHVLAERVSTAQDDSILLQTTGRYETAHSLTATHRWPDFAALLASGSSALTPERVLPLLHEAPASATPMLQAALRRHLASDMPGGLALLDPARPNPFSGRAVCAGGSPAWRRAILPKLDASHDIETALQRQDCLDALSAAKPG